MNQDKRSLVPFILLLVLGGALLIGVIFYLSTRPNVMRLGVNAQIVEIRLDSKQIAVAYTDRFSDTQDRQVKFYIDCNEAINRHQIIYCNYETGDVREISFHDLWVGDDIILSIPEREFERLQDSETIQVQQIQLGTQRLNGAA